MLRAGEIVRGPQWPETVEIKKCEPVDLGFYLVEALGRDTRAYYETLLEEFQLGLVERLSEPGEAQHLDVHSLRRLLQYVVLEAESKFSRARALGSCHVIPLPHQIEAVYDRMLQSPQVRFLLADDPGAGKTIMAGMLIRELQARGLADRILILVPPLVLYQWREELLEKFNQDFQIISRATINECGGKNPYTEHPYCLASIYWAARDDIKHLVRDAFFDFVIVDEAHKMAAYTQGKKVRKTRRTKLYQLGESILRHAPHRLLLTATPHKGDMENFRHLMQLIDPDIFSRWNMEETLREKVNPFIVRRLKENMVNFDGTPLFPPRTVKTIEFNLSAAELDLYEAVTDYVRRQASRAAGSGNTRTSFTMMIFQRRLSSSLEAIHLSLERRYQRLLELLKASMEERKKLQEEMNFDPEQFDEETSQEQAELEEEALVAFDSLDPEELEQERQELEKLLAMSSRIKMSSIERKYKELEETIFGEQGLLFKGEKILIFSEYSDTLVYLERRLKERVPRVAKITGSLSMEHRREQVELFRGDVPIMIATDAGGESINLQFCNQMINYDIPWNPNRLEQRMGRIHRIGQKNEVFIFNLVAGNTREGDVMARLLQKMEQMRKDLGKDLVYDFMGDILEDNYISLAELMQECVLNRQNIDQIIEGIERTLSLEHQRLLQLAAEERLDEESIDLPGMRREQNFLFLKRVPHRVYARFTVEALASRKVAIDGDGNDDFRIEHFSKSVRDFALRKKIRARLNNITYRLTGSEARASDTVQLVTVDHPLFALAMALTRQEWQSVALEHMEIDYPVREVLRVEIHEVGIVDGTGRELTRELLHIARRENGQFFLLDPYWLYSADFTGKIKVIQDPEDAHFRSQAIRKAMYKLLEVRNKREEQLNKKSHFLRRAFEAQYRETMKKLAEYRAANTDNRLSALINQMNAQLIEIEERREQRMAEIERERSIQLRPARRLVQLTLHPDGGKGARSLHGSMTDCIQQYELAAGRSNLQIFNEFGLVDFYSETPKGETRLIITTDRSDYQISHRHKQDLGEWLNRTYLYYVSGGKVVKEELVMGAM